MDNRNAPVSQTDDFGPLFVVGLIAIGKGGVPIGMLL